MTAPESTVITAAAALSGLLRLLEKSGMPATMSAPARGTPGRSTPGRVETPEETAARRALARILSDLCFSEELPDGSVIDVPTRWPAHIGDDAIVLTKTEDGFIATAATFTAADDHALAAAAGEGALVLAPGDPFARRIRRLASGVDRLDALDGVIARLRAFSAAYR